MESERFLLLSSDEINFSNLSFILSVLDLMVLLRERSVVDAPSEISFSEIMAFPIASSILLYTPKFPINPEMFLYMETLSSPFVSDK